MFNGCSSLSFLPDISKWKIKNQIKIERIFDGCKSVISLPDISKCNNNIDPNIIAISSDDYNNSIKLYISNESIEISTKSSSSNNIINSLEEFKDFENHLINEEKDKLEYYDNFYYIES